MPEIVNPVGSEAAHRHPRAVRGRQETQPDGYGVEIRAVAASTLEEKR